MEKMTKNNKRTCKRLDIISRNSDQNNIKDEIAKKCRLN